MAGSRYLIFAIHDVCNARCRHCSLSALADGFTPVSFARFERELPERLAKRPYTGVILSGKEVTLHPELLDFVRFARRQPQVQHVRLETNGMRLADADFVGRLVDVGVDELFVSIAGQTAELHDSITEVPGSFARTLAGLKNLESTSATFSTNTVISTLNYTHLEAVAELIAGFTRLREIHFWGLWPMADRDANDLIAPITAVAGPLRRAIRVATAAGKRAVVKAFPACVLGDCVSAFDTSLPDVVIDRRYFQAHEKNAFGKCLFKGVCQVQSCRALSLAYVRKFGWEETTLRPLGAEQLAAWGAAHLAHEPAGGGI